MFRIKIEPFTGPMDLLLELLAKSKIDIYDIEISSITESFLLVMQQMDISSEELSDFIHMASILVAMKARILLKDQTIDEDDEIPTKEELIERLVAYKKIKELSKRLKEFENYGFEKFAKLQDDLSPYAKEPELEIVGDANLLYESIVEMLSARRKNETSEFYVSKIMNTEEFSLIEIQDSIRERLLKKKKFSFIDLIKDGIISKPKLIVVFLSLLELTKTQELVLSQDEDRNIYIDPLKPIDFE